MPISVRPVAAADGVIHRVRNGVLGEQHIAFLAHAPGHERLQPVHVEVFVQEDLTPLISFSI